MNDPDTEKIKTRIGVYYNYFAKIDDSDVVFTVPYNDSGGFGKRINLVNSGRAQLC